MLQEVKIELTERCERDCIHCSSKAENTNYISLPMDIVKRIIKEAKEMDAHSIVFTGGEATLYPHIEEVVDYATKIGLSTKLYTMATPNEETIQKIKNLTFYGLQEMIYSTTFRLTRDGVVSLERLQDFFPKLLTETPISLGFHHVVTKETYQDIEDSLKLFFSLDDKRTTNFSLLRYIPHGRGDRRLSLTRNEVLRLKEDMTNWKEQYKDKLRLGSPWNFLGISTTPCTAATKTMIIGFDGNVYPCDAMKYFDYLGSGGNIYQSSLSDIYESSYFKEIRALDTCSSECKQCLQYSSCQGGCLGQKMVAFMDTSHITFEEYGNQALRTMRNFETEEMRLENGKLGIAGEIGEFLDSFKKLRTHDVSLESQEKLRKNLMIEAGDILWYLAASLGSSYQISFQDIGTYLNYQTLSEPVRITKTELEKCAGKRDPECLKKVEEKRISLQSLDNRSDYYDFDAEWKKMYLQSSAIICAQDRETVLKASSRLLLSLAAIVNHELGISMEAVAQSNIEKLKVRYQEGYSNEVATKRVTLLTDYKQEEPPKEKIYRRV